MIPHRFRHTFACKYLNRGGNLTVLKSLLGHEKYDTTLIYAKLNQQEIENDYKKNRILIRREVK